MERNKPASFCEIIITLIPNPDKDTRKKKEIIINFFDEQKCKNSK
jgi:hypothetical protein